MAMFGAIGEYAIGQATSGTTTVETYEWLSPFSEPRRSAPRLPSALNPSFSFQPNPVVDVSWFMGLSEPVRYPLSMKPGGQPSSFDVPILTYTPEGWYSPLSEPRTPHRILSTAQHLAMVRAIPPFSPPYARGYVIT